MVVEEFTGFIETASNPPMELGTARRRIKGVMASTSSATFRLMNPALTVAMLWYSLLLFSCWCPSAVEAAPTKAPLAKRVICYQGGSGYQERVVTCRDIDPSYSGTWQCSQIKACERNIQISNMNQLNPASNGGRQCVNTYGCAKSEECVNPQTGKNYNGETLYVRFVVHPLSSSSSRCLSLSFGLTVSLSVSFSGQ